MNKVEEVVLSKEYNRAAIAICHAREGNILEVNALGEEFLINALRHCFELDYSTLEDIEKGVYEELREDGDLQYNLVSTCIEYLKNHWLCGFFEGNEEYVNAVKYMKNLREEAIKGVKESDINLFKEVLGEFFGSDLLFLKDLRDSAEAFFNDEDMIERCMLYSLSFLAAHGFIL